MKIFSESGRPKKGMQLLLLTIAGSGLLGLPGGLLANPHPPFKRTQHLPNQSLSLSASLPKSSTINGQAAAAAREPGQFFPEQTVSFGYSVQGRPLRASLLGNGPNVTLVFGDFHGNERSTPGVVLKLHQFLRDHPARWADCRVLLGVA